MISPPFVQPGDQVAIVAPAGKLVQNSLDTALGTLEQWGLKVAVGKHVWKGCHYFSGTDDERLLDLQHAFDSSEYKAIFCARGGYGLTRIIDQLDFSGLVEYPKWVVGFSDITALHLALSNRGIESIHGIMPSGFGKANFQSVDCLINIIMGRQIATIYSSHVQGNKLGECTAPVIGGNLSLLTASIGTPNEINTKGHILFLEEIDEYLYKIDRMIGQLSRAGKFSQIKGIIIGHFTKIKDTTPAFGKSVQELISDYTAGLDIPVAFGFPIGHEAINLPVVQGATYTLTVSNEGSQLIKVS